MERGPLSLPSIWPFGGSHDALSGSPPVRFTTMNLMGLKGLKNRLKEGKKKKIKRKELIIEKLFL
jgi:hypothetical protein